MNVDIHSHVIPMAFVDAVRAAPVEYATRIEMRGGREHVVHDQGYVYPLFPEFCDPKAKLASMDRRGIDVSIVSPAPPTFFYWAPGALGLKVARMVNDGIAAFVAQAPQRLRPMGTLPLGDPALALTELERIVREHGFRAIEVGTSIEGTLLSDPRYAKVLARCAELGVFVFAHPYYVGARCGMECYYLTNLLGNPWDTTLMASNLLLDGTLDRLPALELCLAHAGGFLPYQIGRLAHGHAVRTETRSATPHSPRTQLRRFHFDSMTFDPIALTFLMNLVGSDRICLGTDDPFDMSEDDPVGLIGKVAGATDHDRHLMCGHNALRLLGEGATSIQGDAR